MTLKHDLIKERVD